MLKQSLRAATILLLAAVLIPVSANAQRRPQGGGAAAPGRAAPAARAAPAMRSAAPMRAVAPRMSAPRSAPSFAGRGGGSRAISVQRQSGRAVARQNFRASSGRTAFRPSRGAAARTVQSVRGSARSARVNANQTLRNRANAVRNNAVRNNAGRVVNPAAGRAAGTTPAGRANTLAAGTRRTLTAPVLRNQAFAARALRAGGRNALAAASFRGRFAAAGAGARRHNWWRRGRVIGWIGPLFWPYASYDVFYYTFYPYYEDTFWPYAYDDVYDGIFGPYAYAEPYDTGPGGSRIPRTTARRSGGTASAARTGGNPASMAQICTQQSAGLTDFPIEHIAQTVEPTEAQKALLENLKTATAKAVDILQGACPTDLPSTPTGRMDALEKRLDAMVAAVDTVRQPLTEFYNSLSDEQKARFNAVEQNPEAGNQRVAREEQSDLSRTCTAGAGVIDVPIQRISQAVRPTGPQRDALEELKNATADAAAALKANCPSYTALTPVGRVELMEQRLKTLLQAVNTVHPALAKFYQSLSDEQKERFNTLSPQQS